MPIRYLFLFVGLVTLTAVGQSTKPDPNIVWFPDGGYACGHPHPDQPSTTSCRMPTDAEIAAHMPKKHKTPVKPAWDETPPIGQVITTPLNTPAPGTVRQCNQNNPHEATCVGCWRLDLKHVCYNYPQSAPVDDGVAHWQAPEKVADQKPEGFSPDGGCNWCQKDGTICDHLPDIQKVTCLMNLVAPEKAVVPEPDPIKTAQDNYDVLPINEEYGTLGFQWCDMGQCVWEDYDPNSALQKALGNKPHRRMRLTCVDKTRFLITSEDSKVHCIAIREPK